MFVQENKKRVAEINLDDRPAKKQKTEKKLLKDHYPALFAELRQEDNIGENLNKITHGMRKNLWWRCKTHTTCDEHKWQEDISKRTRRNTQCPFCSGNSHQPKFCSCEKKQLELKNIDFNSVRTQTVVQNALKEMKNDIEKTKNYINVHYKRCSTCHQYQKLSEFYIYDCKIDSRCSTCEKNKRKKSTSIKSAMLKLFFSVHTCLDCKETDTITFDCDHFENNKSRRKDGTTIRSLLHNPLKKLAPELKKCQVICCYCHRLRTDDNFSLKVPNRPEKFVDGMKLLTGHCFDCERKVTTNNLPGFDYDHLNPEEKINKISRMVEQYCSDEILLAEIKKCQLVCSNCHRHRTATTQKWRKLSDFPEDIIQRAKEELAVVGLWSFENDK